MDGVRYIGKFSRQHLELPLCSSLRLNIYMQSAGTTVASSASAFGGNFAGNPRSLQQTVSEMTTMPPVPDFTGNGLCSARHARVQLQSRAACAPELQGFCAFQYLANIIVKLRSQAVNDLCDKLFVFSHCIPIETVGFQHINCFAANLQQLRTTSLQYHLVVLQHAIGGP